MPWAAVCGVSNQSASKFPSAGSVRCERAKESRARCEDDGMLLLLLAYEVGGESTSSKDRKRPSVVDTPLLVRDLGACE